MLLIRIREDPWIMVIKKYPGLLTSSENKPQQQMRFTPRTPLIGVLSIGSGYSQQILGPISRAGNFLWDCIKMVSRTVLCCELPGPLTILTGVHRVGGITRFIAIGLCQVGEGIPHGSTYFHWLSSWRGAWGAPLGECRRDQAFLWLPRMRIDSCMVPNIKMTLCQILIGGRLDKYFSNQWSKYIPFNSQ